MPQILLMLLACAGQPAVDPNLPAVMRTPPPPLTCPSGAAFFMAPTPRGLDQWCEKAGKMEGPYAVFFNDGTRQITGAYKANEPHADWIWNWPDGRTRSKVTYKDGRYVGTWSSWYPSGKEQERGDFLDGKRAGTWSRWYENGQLAEEGGYRGGQKDGTWQTWSETGEPGESETWQNGALFADK